MYHVPLIHILTDTDPLPHLTLYSAIHMHTIHTAGDGLTVSCDTYMYDGNWELAH